MIAETTACREAALNGRLAFLNLGTPATAAAIQLYGGVRPASPNDAPGTPLLVQASLQNPAGSVAAGALTLLSGDPAMVAASGTATWARVVNGEGASAFDMDAGGVGSSAECKLSSVELFAGGLVVIVSAVLS